MAPGFSSSGHRLRRGIAAVAIVACCVGGLLGWAAIVVSYRYTEVFRQDWMVYHAAGILAREGRLALLYDSLRFTGFQFATFPAEFARPPDLHPFLYPPPYLLLLAPLSLLSLPVAYGVFVLATTAAGVAALASWGRGLDWPRGLMLLAFPATAINALTGQNALLTVALLAGGMRLLDASPATSGALLGLLVYKPQFFLLVPVALAASRNWLALAAALASAAALVLTSAALFGLSAWTLWFHQTVLAEDAAYAAWFADTFEHGFSLFVAALLLGAPESAARVVQALAGLAATAAVWWGFVRPRPHAAQLAVLLAATAVLTPHLQSYDLALVAAAAILLFTGEMGPGELVLYGAVWALPLLRPYNSATGRALVPAVLIAMLACALRQARRT